MKDAQDFVVLARACAKAVKEAKADGTVDWRDAPKVVQVLGPLREAVKDSQKIPEQVKAATSEQLSAFAGDSVSALTELVDAFLG
jgi:hypothetical protein